MYVWAAGSVSKTVRVEHWLSILTQAIFLTYRNVVEGFGVASLVIRILCFMNKS